MNKKHESSVITYSPADSLDARMEIFSMMNHYQATDEEKERSLPLFLRGSVLARIFAVAEIYQKIVDLPGVVLDIGTWRGQTAVLCENFRAIFEPLHFNRRIIAFDTFEGYKGFGEKDKATDLHAEGTYTLNQTDYRQFLEDLLVLHERSNAMGNIHGKHSVIQGDCLETIPRFFADNPNEFAALSFFDVNAYTPTLKSFEQIWPRIVPGGVVAFWQLTRDSVPAEGRVFCEQILPAGGFQLHRTKTYPGLCYLVKK
jgi:hypothetical protein